jgi:hypothetical protein
VISNAELTTVIKDYLENKIEDEAVLSVFRQLATAVFLLPSFHFETDQSVVDDAAYYCLERIDRFDLSKGKAFNVFTTIIACSLRQSKRLYSKRISG